MGTANHVLSMLVFILLLPFLCSQELLHLVAADDSKLYGHDKAKVSVLTMVLLCRYSFLINRA